LIHLFIYLQVIIINNSEILEKIKKKNLRFLLLIFLLKRNFFSSIFKYRKDSNKKQVQSLSFLFLVVIFHNFNLFLFKFQIIQNIFRKMCTHIHTHTNIRTYVLLNVYI